MRVAAVVQRYGADVAEYLRQLAGKRPMAELTARTGPEALLGLAAYVGTVLGGLLLLAAFSRLSRVWVFLFRPAS